MIALLSCSMSLFANDSAFPSTGEVDNRADSVLIAYDDLRLVNSKLIQLEYEQQINNNLRTIIANDSIIINDYTNINKRLNADCKKAIRQRNICFSVGVVGIIASCLLLLK